MIYKFKTGGILKLQSGKKIYKHNNYYGYINKIQAQATANPEWFWSDSADASEARQWLYDNGAGAVVDEIYRNTPAEIQKTISSRKLSRKVSDERGTQQLVSDIHSAQKNFMDTVGAIGLQSAGTTALGAGLVLAPEVTIPSLVGGLAGGHLTDKLVQKISDGKYPTFGSFVRQNNDWGQTGNLLAEFANPGFYIGGGAAAKIVGRTTPMVIKSMQNSLWKTAPATGNPRYPEFTTKIRLNASEPVKWKWAKEGAYDDGVISAPLFARKSQVAHELGHHAGGQGDMILGAYTPEYSYGTGASWERQRAENFADWFRTKLGYPYKGRDLGMLARQQAIDSNPTKILTNITNARRYGETAKPGQISETERLGVPKGERNLKTKWKFQSSYGDKVAKEIADKKRDIWGRWIKVAEKRYNDYHFNQYHEPIIPELSPVMDNIEPNSQLLKQSKLIDVYSKYRKIYSIDPNDVYIRPDDVKASWEEYFRSPAYKKRVLRNSGLNESEASDFIESQIEAMRTADWTFDPVPDIQKVNVSVYDPKTGDFDIRKVNAQSYRDGYYDPNWHHIHVYNARSADAIGTFEHELLHSTLGAPSGENQLVVKSLRPDIREPKMTKLPFLNNGQAEYSNGLVVKNPKDLNTDLNFIHNYLTKSDEPRVRGLKILKYLDENNLPITEENVKSAIDSINEFDVDNMKNFTSESLNKFLNNLYIVPIIAGAGIGAAASSNQK